MDAVKEKQFCDECGRYRKGSGTCHRYAIDPDSHVTRSTPTSVGTLSDNENFDCPHYIQGKPPSIWDKIDDFLKH